MTPTADDLGYARVLWDYLRLGIPVRPAECLLLFGGHDIGVATRAADLYDEGIAPLIVVSGASPTPNAAPSPLPADAGRILSHLAGEALRLEAYTATGLIDPGEPFALHNRASVRGGRVHLSQFGMPSRYVAAGK